MKTNNNNAVVSEPGQLEVVAAEAGGTHNRAVRGGAAHGARAQPAPSQVQDLQRDAGGTVSTNQPFKHQSSRQR